MPFVALVAFAKTFFWRRDEKLPSLIGKWLLIALATGALYLALNFAHSAINGFETERLRVEQAEKFAAPGFRPSEIAQGKAVPRLALRTRGAEFRTLFFKYGWARRSFESFSGVYHWMTLDSAPAYYLFMGALYLALLGFIGAALRRYPWSDALFVVAVFGVAILVLLVSAYHSWTVDFQPQGRYLFPILPMLAFILHRYRDGLRQRTFQVLLACLFAGSVFSFVFTGLRGIPK